MYNDAKWKDIVVTEEDEKIYAKFNYHSAKGVEKEFADALHLIDHPIPPLPPVDSSCCTIL